MTTPTQVCVKCRRPFSAEFDRCPFCKEPVPPREKPKVPPVKCPRCGRLINASFTQCPFCKQVVTPSARQQAPSQPKFDYTAIAADAVEHNKVYLDLDYSPASVLALDVFFNEMWGTEGYSPNNDDWTANQGQVAVIMNFGSYFGEVIRRRYNGRWQEDQAQDGNPLWTTVALPSGDHLYVISKVFKRLKNGSTDALYPMLLSLRQSLGDQPSGEELESWLRQAKHLEKVKRPDLALKFYDCALQLPLLPGDHMAVIAEKMKAQAAAKAMDAENSDARDGKAPEKPADQAKPPAGPPDFAAGIEAIRPALNLAGVVLNDTPASLAAIDIWLDHLTGRDPLPEAKRARYKEHEWAVGCYLGELFCLKYGASWSPDEEHPDCSHVSWPIGFVTCPFAYHSKRMECGSEYGIYQQFLTCISMLKEKGAVIPARDESAEWMEQAEAFAGRTRRWDLAAAFARRALQFRPDSAAINSRIGDFISEMKEQRDNAGIWYDKALSLDISLKSAWTGKARLLHAQGRSGQAYDCLQRSYDASSRETSFHMLKADILRALGRDDESLETYRLAISLDEKLVPAWLGVAACQESSGSIEDAVGTLAKVAALPGSTAEASFHKGELEEKLGRVNDAVASYNTANYRAGSDEDLKSRICARLEALENTPERLKLKAEDLAGAGNMQGAIEVYRRILQMTPDNAEAWGEAGTGFSLMGDIDSALAHFDKAISLDPSMVKNWDHKAVSLARVKQIGRAHV